MISMQDVKYVLENEIEKYVLTLENKRLLKEVTKLKTENFRYISSSENDRLRKDINHLREKREELEKLRKR